ncbi:MAG: hypothetical protein B1H03_05855 [Planctomycetales bacterium 4484_113]|nr:MAG: hypothetical protein B1H03_05855 [Planctomycetales bacterium 4484_113]
MSDPEPEKFLNRCPNCGRTVLVQAGVCPSCGFPFICELEKPPPPEPWNLRGFLARLTLFVGLLAFSLYFTLTGYTFGEGYTARTINQLVEQGIEAAPIPVLGPSDFSHRVDLALNLLRSRAPRFYQRVTGNLTSVTYLPEGTLRRHGRNIYLTGVAAYVDPASGATRVRIPGAYLSGTNVLFDRDIFYLAGVLVHEARHRELFKSGLSVGGIAEEYECESTAYDALVQMGAPRALIYSLAQFLQNPYHKRYKAWKRYYEQYHR